jgi:hypothetical protein
MLQSFHVFFWHSSQGEKKICCVPSAIATVRAVLAEAAPRTTWLERQSSALGGAGPAPRVFMPGRPRWNMPGTCIAKSAATWTCRVFRANTGSAISPGYSECCALPRIAAPCAEIGFSRFGFTGESCLRNIPLNPEWNHIPHRASGVFPSEHGEGRRLTSIARNV